MDADSESRQGVFAAVSATLTAAKAKLAATRKLRNKGRIFVVANLTVLSCWSMKPQDIKRGATTFLEEEEKTARTQFQREKYLENLISLKILLKIELSKPRIQALTRISALSMLFPTIFFWVCYFLYFSILYPWRHK